MPDTTKSQESREAKSPAFQFYPKDFLTDDKVLCMSAEVRGLYITLLCVDWLNDGVYGSAILKLCGFDWLRYDGTLRNDSSEIEAQLLDCFEPHPSKEGFVTNPRIQKERLGQIERRNERSASGKKGAGKRWKISHALANGSAIKEPMANDSSSSSSSSSSSNIYLYKDDEPKPPSHLSTKKDRLVEKAPNVWLTDSECDRLLKKFGSIEEVQYLILELSSYSRNKSKAFKTYSDHYDTLLNWRRMKHSKAQTFFDHPINGPGYYPNYEIERVSKNGGATA